MRKQYHSSNGRRGALFFLQRQDPHQDHSGQRDHRAFRAKAEAKRIGYQTAINEALRSAIQDEEAPVDVVSQARSPLADYPRL